MPKISALTADASPTSDDLVATVNDPGGTPASRKVTLGNIFGAGLNARFSQLALAAATELTIASGEITATQGVHKLQPESSTSDDLDTISGGSEGDILLLYLTDAGTDTITLKHGTGNISVLGGGDIALSEGVAALYYNGTAWLAVGGRGGGGGRGWVDIRAAMPPTTSGAPLDYRAGGSTPVEEALFYSFVNGSVTYRDFLCVLRGYGGGGLTFHFQVMAPTVTSGTFIFEAAIRRMADDAEDIDTAHTYDYNAATVTVASAAGETKYFTIEFTNGADMDSLTDGEVFILRVRRNGGTAAEAAQLLPTIWGEETT